MDPREKDLIKIIIESKERKYQEIRLFVPTCHTKVLEKSEREQNVL